MKIEITSDTGYQSSIGHLEKGARPGSLLPEAEAAAIVTAGLGDDLDGNVKTGKINPDKPVSLKVENVKVASTAKEK